MTFFVAQILIYPYSDNQFFSTYYCVIVLRIIFNFYRKVLQTLHDVSLDSETNKQQLKEFEKELQKSHLQLK